MKKTLLACTFFSIGLCLLAPVSVLAQKEDNHKDVKDEKTKDIQQIIITRKNDSGDKVVIEVNGDKITVNGKPVDQNDKDGDVMVRTNRIRTMDGLSRVPGVSNWNYNGDNVLSYVTIDDNRAMLGVTTNKAEEGAQIEEVTKESGAEKAGLKEDDIITKVDDSKIEGPDELTAAIKKHKPGDKVSITYIRDKKEQKTTAELTKWKGMNPYAGNFKIDMPDMNFKLYNDVMPKLQTLPRMNGQGWNWSGNGPKLGLSVQDTDDGKGVKVIDVDDESNAAKAGLKEDDLITEVDGKAVNGADEMAKIVRESKDKVSIMVKITRSGKTQNVEVKMPRKIKTADL